MTGKYYTIQISYSTQNPMGKISISLKTRVRLPGHPQTFFNELPTRRSRKGQVDPAIYAITSTAKQKRETKDVEEICESSPRTKKQQQRMNLADNKSSSEFFYRNSKS